MKYIIDNQWIYLSQLEVILDSCTRIELGPNAKKSIIECRKFLDEKLRDGSELMYGINTGFGFLCDTIIPPEQLEILQRNLVLSHACGAGEELPDDLVRRMLLLKILSLSKGYSGVELETVERLVYFYNEQILPVVYEQGSLGASGDLAPLAHLSLPLIGEGEVKFRGKRLLTKDLYNQRGLKPLVLKSKEGLALLNGTQFMCAFAAYAVTQAIRLWENWNLIAALSLEAFDGRLEPFDAKVNEIRNHPGQVQVASRFRRYLEGSKLVSTPKRHVQDPYSFRCIPQVHGATKDTIDYVLSIIEREINAVTDNPTLFPQENYVVSAGNFHGQPLALCMDFLAIAMAEMASISERRSYKLVSGTRDLPPFLVANSGLNSGLMIAQYMCASIVSQNKQLCTPASVDTIDSSNGQEDHVSMGANAGTKLYRVIQNCQTVQGIELLHGAQALEFRKLNRSSEIIKQLFFDFRINVPFIKDDVYLHPLIVESVNFTKKILVNDGNK